MWNISKMANGRAKRTKIWDSGSYNAYKEGTFDARFLESGLGSFDTLCKISNFTIFKLRSSPNFHLIHTNFIQCILIIQAVTFFGDRPKIAKIMAF